MDINDIVKRVTQEIQREMAAKTMPAQAKDEACSTGACSTLPPAVSAAHLACKIEHSVLNPDMSKQRIVKECELAMQHKFANVCVTPYFVGLAADLLKTSPVGICAPVGFPHGAASTTAKLAEIKECVANGATELDVSLNMVAIKSGDFDEAARELKQMIAAADYKAKVKAIYEQGLLTDDEKKRTLELIANSGADYVKISNALTGKKACVDDVAFVRGIVGNSVKIKIDGGIKTAGVAEAILNSGADRIGCSASVAIVTGK